MGDYSKPKFFSEGEYTQEDLDDCYEARFVDFGGVWLFYSYDQLRDWAG